MPSHGPCSCPTLSGALSDKWRHAYLKLCKFDPVSLHRGLVARQKAMRRDVDGRRRDGGNGAGKPGGRQVRGGGGAPAGGPPCCAAENRARGGAPTPPGERDGAPPPPALTVRL